jgi:hypothetical protein
MPYFSKSGASSSIEAKNAHSLSVGRLGSPESSVAIVGTSRSLAICSRRRKLRTCIFRVHSSGDDQLNTGLNVSIFTPDAAIACFTFAMSASFTLG